MNHVLKIGLKEPVHVDQDRLAELYTELGEAGAEDVVCRAMEELALRLSHSNRLHSDGNLVDLRKCVRSLIAIADQIGMHLLAEVCNHVVNAIDSGDSVAVSATLARLLRIGEQSLTAIWDLQDLTI